MASELHTNGTGPEVEATIDAAAAVPTEGATAVPDQVFDPVPLSQDFGAELGIVHSQSVKLGRPFKSAWVRVHPGVEHEHLYRVLDLGGAQMDLYLVARELYAEHEDYLSLWRLFPTIVRTGELQLWPVKAGDNEWLVTALEAAHLARTKWVQVKSNHDLRRYDYKPSELQLEPTWPNWTAREWVRKGFEGRVILKRDHPVLKGLRGE